MLNRQFKQSEKNVRRTATSPEASRFYEISERAESVRTWNPDDCFRLGKLARITDHTRAPRLPGFASGVGGAEEC